MQTNYDNRKWSDLGAHDKMKLSLASFLIISSVIMGFVSFIWLTVIPTSVIATIGLFGSEALAILGISSYFHNELVKFESNVEVRMKRLSKKDNDNEDEIS